MSQVPEYLKTFKEFKAHLDEQFVGGNVAKGKRFAQFSTVVLSFVEELSKFPSINLNEKLSNDDGVDIISARSLDGGTLFAQSRYTISTKSEIDQIVSAFQAYETSRIKLGTQGDLFGPPATSLPATFAIVTSTDVSAIRARYEAAHFSSRPYYDKLPSSGRLIWVDGPNIKNLLQVEFNKTFGQPVTITIRSAGGWIGSNNVRLGFIPATELVRLYREHGDAIFFENLREFLGISSSKKDSRTEISVNEEIMKTVKQEPEKLLERNNGITFRATNINDLEDGILELKEASIINGCQTTMCLVSAKSDISLATVQVKIVESLDAWDVARSANHQNTVERIEMDLARYVRPQAIRQLASELGYGMSSSSADVVSLFESFYDNRFSYGEIKNLFIGVMSDSPNNIGYQSYSKLRPNLLNAFANSVELQKSLMETLFLLAVTTNDVMKSLSDRLSSREHIRPFVRVFNEQKTSYRSYFGILALCGLLRIDLSERAEDDHSEVDRLSRYIREARRLIETEKGLYARALVFSIEVFSSDARTSEEDDVKISQHLSSLLRKGFTTKFKDLVVRLELQETLNSFQ